jgi:putative thioredoxin
MNHDVTDFETQVLARSQEVPVLCDFWAPWCGPCVMFGPLLEKVAAEAGGKWELAKLNVDENQAVAERFRISGIPAIKLFHHGKVLAESAGAMGERSLREWLEENLPGGAGETWSAVEEALGGLRFAEAEALLKSPEVPEGKRRDFLLAKATLWCNPQGALDLAGEAPAAEVEPTQWEAVVFLAKLLAAEAVAGGESAHDEACEKARTLLQSGNLPEAMDLLTTILWEKPRFRDGNVVRLQRALIQYLGIRHPLSARHYSAYSGAASLL